MRFPGPLRAAAACALLGAVGCDYWSNLVEQKSVTKADLVVYARDAWTDEIVSGAVCIDSVRKETFATNNAGTQWLAGAATGHYSIRCSSPIDSLYHDAGADGELIRGGKELVIKFARRGGKEWYLDIDRAVRLPDMPDSIRFPAGLDWTVTPEDEKGAFRYEWTFKNAAGLNRGHLEAHGQVGKNAFLPRFEAKATSDEGVKPGRDSVMLKVFSRLNGAKNEYLVDSAEAEINWVRNRKPIIMLDSGGYLGDTRVGCTSDPIYIRPQVIARDSDETGECAKIRLWAEDKESSLKIDTILSCQNHPPPLIQLYLPKRHGEPRADGSETYESILLAEITDDNGETSRDTLVVKTHTNAPPTATARIVDPKPGYYVEDEIFFELTAGDSDGHFEDLGFTWTGDDSGQAANFGIHPEENPPKHAQILLTPATFAHAEWITVFSRAHDECGADAFPKSFRILIEKDSTPVISYSKPDTARIGDSLRVRFDLTLTDYEVSLNKDHYSKIRITWDDKRAQTDSTRTGERVSGRAMEQMYPYPAQGEHYTVKIHVEDAHHKKADTSFQVP